MANRFDGKIVVISGAAGGFGRRFVSDFCAAGARVFACDIRDDGLDDARRNGATTKVLNLTDRAATSAWIAEVETQAGGAVDILVNNAGGHGGAQPKPIADVPDAEWDSIMANNVGATVALSRAAVPSMKRAGRGRIVNISSGAGIAASRIPLHPYTAAKHAIVGLTRQMAAELGEFGITVNSVAPGFVTSTPHTQKLWDDMPEQGKRAHLQRTFMRRVGKVDDVANAVLFLASDQTSWITGQVLSVDGGVG